MIVCNLIMNMVKLSSIFCAMLVSWWKKFHGACFISSQCMYWYFQVQVWLEKLYGDKPVPAYELNEYTVGVLHNLMSRNERKERDTQLLIQDLRQKADEYNAEGTVKLLLVQTQKKNIIFLPVQTTCMRNYIYQNKLVFKLLQYK